MRKNKRWTATMLAIVMTVLAGFVDWKNVEANEATDDLKIEYEALDMSVYWKANGEGKAPVKPGYVFGGWYSAKNDNEESKLMQVPNSGTTYAKWVPSYVLSVKAQIEADKEDGLGESEKTYIRLISSVDTTYSEYGYNVIYNKRAGEEKFDKDYRLIPGETEGFYLYKTIRAQKEETSKSRTPQEIFGDCSEYFFVLQLTGISYNNSVKPIYVRPYWVTHDGTKVEGLAKYVRVIDGYSENQYISVPVNLAESDGNIAAGVVTMTYDSEVVRVVKTDGNIVRGTGIDNGIGLDNVTCHDDGNGKIVFTADTSPINSDGSTSYIGNTFTDINPTKYTYANVWFELIDGTDVGQLNKNGGNQLEFAITTSADGFCNWQEETVNVKLHNYYY